MKTITIDVDLEGNAKMEGGGFKGKECDAKMAEFEKEMGDVKNRQNKLEYHQTNTATQKVGQ